MIQVAAVCEALERLGISQRQIRMLLGYNAKTWRDRERRLISADRVDRIAMGLGLLPIELLGFEVWCAPCLDDDDLAELELEVVA